MKVKLPKDIVGVKFPKICTIDMNDFDIDLFLPSLFFTILAQARGKVRQTNKPTEIQKFIDALAHHPMLEGFDDPEGRKVLERLVRTTLITTGGVGRSSSGEQITSIVPYSLLAHKPGFPAAGSRQRSADIFIYQALREHVGADNALRDFVKKVFGKGIIVGSISELGGRYDGTTQLDTLARLSLAFLDGFENTRPAQKSRENKARNPCPKLTKEFATDIYSYLFTYHASMPVQAFTHHLLILINFELFSYTLKLVQAVNELVQYPDILPVAMRDSVEISQPQIYLDFMDSPTGYSLEMARACVRRDVETYQQFLFSNVLLRQLDVYAETLKHNPRLKTTLEKILNPELSGGEYLQELLRLQSHSEIGINLGVAANSDEVRIREENTQIGEEDDSEALKWLDTIVESAEGSVERVVGLLVEGQKSQSMKHLIQWYWGTGGLKKAHGILRGSVLSRKSWRYAPTNDLLAVLVQLAAAPRMTKETREEEVQEVPPIRLQEFLHFLEKRFGILVDRPPAQFEGAEYAAAARDNLRAMLRRLQQMGIFQDLSDDFTVQRLHPPYAGKIAAKVEV